MTNAETDTRTDAEVDAEVEENMARGKVHFEKLMSALAGERDPDMVAHEIWVSLTYALRDAGWTAKELRDDVAFHAKRVR